MKYETYESTASTRLIVSIPGRARIELWAEPTSEYDDVEVMIDAPRDIVVEREEVRRRMRLRGLHATR